MTRTHYPAVFVDNTSRGTRVESCPLTALATAGLESGLYRMCGTITELFGIPTTQAAAAQDAGSGPFGNCGWEAIITKTWDLFHEKYKWGFPALDHECIEDTVRMDWSRLTSVEYAHTHDTDNVSAYKPLESPFFAGEPDAHVNVSLVLHAPACKYVLANVFRHFFFYARVSLLHGKHGGLHEVGEHRGRCDMCAVVKNLEQAILEDPKARKYATYQTRYSRFVTGDRDGGFVLIKRPE